MAVQKLESNPGVYECVCSECQVSLFINLEESEYEELPGYWDMKVCFTCNDSQPFTKAQYRAVLSMRAFMAGIDAIFGMNFFSDPQPGATYESSTSKDPSRHGAGARPVDMLGRQTPQLTAS